MGKATKGLFGKVMLGEGSLDDVPLGKLYFQGEGENQGRSETPRRLTPGGPITGLQIGSGGPAQGPDCTQGPLYQPPLHLRVISRVGHQLARMPGPIEGRPSAQCIGTPGPPSTAQAVLSAQGPSYLFSGINESIRGLAAGPRVPRGLSLRGPPAEHSAPLSDTPRPRPASSSTPLRFSLTSTTLYFPM
ncbi:unnamed protein product [Lota lota]